MTARGVQRVQTVEKLIKYFAIQQEVKALRRGRQKTGDERGDWTAIGTTRTAERARDGGGL